MTLTWMRLDKYSSSNITYKIMEKTKYKDIFIYDFDDVNEIIVCGDIHGEFNALVNKV